MIIDIIVVASFLSSRDLDQHEWMNNVLVCITQARVL
jgi:hypothetical protein